MAAATRTGEGSSVRAAADFLVGGAQRDAAERCWSDLQERCGKCNRVRPPEKTRRSEGGRLAVERRQRRAQGQPAPCACLGLTPPGSQTRHGQCAVRRTTLAQRVRQTLQAGQETRRRRLPWPSPPPGAWLKSVRLGHSRDSAVPRHGSLLTVCRDALRRSWCQTLRRRSQRHRMPWPRLYALAEHWLPTPHPLHPYPAPRLCVTTRGRSPVRSCRTPGSVRGVPGNRHPYRDPTIEKLSSRRDRAPLCMRLIRGSVWTILHTIIQTPEQLWDPGIGT